MLILLFSRSNLKVTSAVFSNLVAFWLVANIATTNPLTILSNFLYSIITWYIAVKAEEISEAL